MKPKAMHLTALLAALAAILTVGEVRADRDHGYSRHAYGSVAGRFKDHGRRPPRLHGRAIVHRSTWKPARLHHRAPSRWRTRWHHRRRPVCQAVVRVLHARSGHVLKMGATRCLDAYGRPYIIPGSRHVLKPWARTQRVRHHRVPAKRRIQRSNHRQSEYRQSGQRQSGQHQSRHGGRKVSSVDARAISDVHGR
jgi:hypothetical protein